MYLELKPSSENMGMKHLAMGESFKVGTGFEEKRKCEIFGKK